MNKNEDLSIISFLETFVLICVFGSLIKLFFDFLEVINNILHKLPIVKENAKLVRVLTYNIFLRPPGVKNNKSDHKELRMEQFLKEIPNYDIIALQEMFALGSSRKARLIKYAKKCGFHYYSKSTPPILWSKKFIDAGLLILSRYPIVESAGYIYSAGSQIDFYAAKQIIYAKIELSQGKTFNLFTTHLQATYSQNSKNFFLANNKARAHQVKEMITFMKKHTGSSSEPCLLVGDLNINAKVYSDDPKTESAEYLSLMDEFKKTFPDYKVRDLIKEANNGLHLCTYADADIIVDPETGTSKINPKETVLTHTHDLGTQECIDYMILLEKGDNTIFTPKETRVEKFFTDAKPVTQLSDHYGISTQLHLNQ